MPGAPWHTRHSDHYSAQLAFAMTRPGASSNVGAPVGTAALSGALVVAEAFEWASPFDLPGSAAAVEGPTPIAAITAARATILALRLPDLIFAISTSLSRRILSARRSYSIEPTLRAAQRRCVPLPGEARPSFTRSGDLCNEEGAPTTRVRPIARKKVNVAASQLEQHLPWQPRRQAASRRGISFAKSPARSREPW